MKIRLLYAGSGDWVGLYINDKLVMQGHDLQLPELIRKLVPDADFKNVLHEDEYLECYGYSCPDMWPKELG